MTTTWREWRSVEIRKKVPMTASGVGGHLLEVPESLTTKDREWMFVYSLHVCGAL